MAPYIDGTEKRDVARHDVGTDSGGMLCYETGKAARRRHSSRIAASRRTCSVLLKDPRPLSALKR
jgi:hypothetical protein